MEMIRSCKGKSVVILYDDDDHDLISQYWWALKPSGYVEGQTKTSVDGKCVYVRMHRLVMHEYRPDVEVDHINFIKHDNRKINLRRCNNIENHRHFSTRNKDTGYYGVKVSNVKRPSGKVDTYFRVDVRVNKKRFLVGHFKDPKEAAIARDNFVKIHHGEFAALNFPEL